MKYINKIVYGSILTLLLSSSSYADCSYELFTISSTKDTKIIDFVEQLSDECEFSVIVTDPNAEKFLETKLNKTHLKNLTIDEVLAIVLKENNLYYTLESNLLRISYLKTEIFGIDYILSQRTGKGQVNVSLSSASASGGTGGIAQSNGGGTLGAGQGNSSAQSGMVIESSDEVKFWADLDKELQSVINRPHDVYKADAPIINKNAGLITVTATIKQMDRFRGYLKRLQEKVQLQVLIDVQLLSVTLNEGQDTGIDWSQLYALQSFDVSIDGSRSDNKNIASSGNPIVDTINSVKNIGSMVSITGGGKLNQVIKFLKTQGDVVSISNPKVLTLNNQPALITAGTEYFYKIINTETLAGGTSGAQAENQIIESVFAGVLLAITPEIADDDTITLKVNPSLSETAQDMSTNDSGDRVMPPDLNRRQLSSVVTVKDGNRIILGGLINTRNITDVNKVPLLGDIPIVNYLFKYEKIRKQVQELVIIIEPHIIDKDNNDLSLADLGYKGVTDETVILNNNSMVDQNLELKERTDKALNKL